MEVDSNGLFIIPSLTGPIGPNGTIGVMGQPGIPDKA